MKNFQIISKCILLFVVVILSISSAVGQNCVISGEERYVGSRQGEKVYGAYLNKSCKYRCRVYYSIHLSNGEVIKSSDIMPADYQYGFDTGFRTTRRLSVKIIRYEILDNSASAAPIVDSSDSNASIEDVAATAAVAAMAALSSGAFLRYRNGLYGSGLDMGFLSSHIPHVLLEAGMELYADKENYHGLNYSVLATLFNEHDCPPLNPYIGITRSWAHSKYSSKAISSGCAAMIGCRLGGNFRIDLRGGYDFIRDCTLVEAGIIICPSL